MAGHAMKIRFGNVTMAIPRHRLHWYRWFYGREGLKVRVLR